MAVIDTDGRHRAKWTTIRMALGPFHVAQMLRENHELRGAVMLMRHGETDWNREGRVMGRNPVELNAHGRAQVEAAAQFARTIKPDLIISSPLVRARQSADLMAAGLGGVPIIEEPSIAEVMYGRWEGMVYHDLVNDPYYLEYRKMPLEYPTPGGETIIQVQARGVEAVTRALGEHPGSRLLFVSHGDIIRTVLCHFMGLELGHFHRLRVDNASISTIQISGKFAELKFLNLLADPEQAFIPPFPIKKPEEKSPQQA